MQFIISVFFFRVHVSEWLSRDVDDAVFYGIYLFGWDGILVDNEVPAGKIFPVEQLGCFLCTCFVTGTQKGGSHYCH